MSVINFEPTPGGARFGANVIVPRKTASGPGARIDEEMYTKLKIANKNQDLQEHSMVRSRDLVRRFIGSLKMHEDFGTDKVFANPFGQWHFTERRGWSIIGRQDRSYAPGLYDPRPIYDGHGNEFYMVLPSEGGVVGSGGFGKVLLFEYNSRNPGSATPLYKDFVMKISADPSEKEGLDMLTQTNADEECVCARLIKEAKVSEYPIYEANLNKKTAREIGYLFGESDTRYFTVMEKGDGTLAEFLSAHGQGVNAMTAFQLVYGMFQDIKYVYEKSQRDAIDRRQNVRNGILMSDAKLENFLCLKTLENSDGNRKLRIFPCDFGSFCYSWDETQPAVVCSTEYCSPADDYAHVGIACDGYPDDVDDKTGGNFPSIGHVAFCLGTMLMQLMDGPLHDNPAHTKDACCFYKRLGQFELQVRSIDPDTNARGPITKEQIRSYLTKVKYVQFALNTYAADDENDRLMFPDRNAVAPLVKQLLNFRHVGRMVYNKGPKKGREVAPSRKYEDADDYTDDGDGDDDGTEDGERGEGKKPLYKPHPDSFTVPAPVAPGVSAGTALYRTTVADNLKILEDAIKNFTASDPSIATTASAAAITCVDRWAKGECNSIHNQEDVEAVSDYRFCPPEYNPAAQSMDDLENLFQMALYKLLKVDKFKPFGQLAGKTQGLNLLSPYPKSVVLKRLANAAIVERKAFKR